MFQIKRLKDRHIVAAALAACGSTPGEIAQALGLTPSWVSVLFGSALFKAEVERQRIKFQNQLCNDAVGMLFSETLNNVKTLRDIRDNINLSPHVRLRAADSMLDRVSATSKIQKTENKTLNANLTNEQVEFLIKALDDDPIANAAFKTASQRSFIELAEVEDPEILAEAAKLEAEEELVNE